MRERCSRVGTVSETHNKWDLSIPSKMNARTRARSWGSSRDWVTLTKRRAHCCNKVASKALVRLMTKLKNQSEFTQTACPGGEKGGGVTKLEGTDTRDTFGSARS